jgi:hypothetical protein
MEAGGEATKKSNKKAQGFALRWENFSKVFYRGVFALWHNISNKLYNSQKRCATD